MFHLIIIKPEMKRREDEIRQKKEEVHLYKNNRKEKLEKKVGTQKQKTDLNKKIEFRNKEITS